MELILSFVLPLAIGYVAAIFTWPKIKTWINGAEAEAANLKAQADTLIARAKSAI